MEGTLLKFEDYKISRRFEDSALRQGFKYIAGVDEAGRGALAGPVVAAAVIFPHGVDIPGIDDSKKLSPLKREKLFDLINDKSLAVSVDVGDNSVVDELNILRATLLTMKNAVLALSVRPDYVLVDGNCAIPVDIPQKTIIKGDSISFSVAAASIIAKVTRDRLMVKYDMNYPGYGFASNKGYGCASHLAAIAELNPCEIHRKTFRGVKEYLKENATAG